MEPRDASVQNRKELERKIELVEVNNKIFFLKLNLLSFLFFFHCYGLIHNTIETKNITVSENVLFRILLKARWRNGQCVGLRIERNQRRWERGWIRVPALAYALCCVLGEDLHSAFLHPGVKWVPANLMLG